ncbi:efflux RND transporter periplasmic adaptor subunit [Pseudohalocynthiibacter aestuariivivens]|uniref:Efflux RND transporter periplasmic adaptor subunit n=1 Tax=Pseudohalocynthiibacter aestuariivivens TaxID=1591409 RepID=A0ABV5JE14_9RHOB|nr:efflux RND transporter periplasmic adaptor subunit [Pseudohalocynthiibacter aestuariivivens]MBS9718563.1 efflux RND transporter periplasmic adaptor subunit [Pseudohalocynthiibacter aestuariivivens]
MRFFSVLTAILVSGFLYALIMERESLLSFASGDPSVSEAPAGEAEEVPSEPKRLVSVVALRTMAQTVDQAVLLRGQTEAARQVEVRAETSALVLSEPLRKGAHVEAGQVLCELDPGTRVATLAEAEARRAEAQINFTAAAKLAEDGFASETRAAAARAALQAAEAGVEAAKKEIERLRLRAPFAGLLETDTAELGALLQPGALCATLLQLNPIKLVGFVPETEVSRVSLGAMAGSRLATGDEVVGQVTFLSRSADPLTRTFRVEIEVNNVSLNIRDGQTAEIIISAEGTSAHLLPQSALTLNNDGRLGVRLVGEGDVAVFAPVTILRDTIEGVWVAGLPDTASVITAGQEYVTSGTRIAVTYSEVAQ